MFCKWCGVQNDHDAVFCSSCGKQMTGAGPSVAAPTTGEVDAAGAVVPDDPSTVAAPSTAEVVAPGTPPPPSEPSAAPVSMPRNMAPLVLVGAILAALLVGGLVLLTGGSDDADRTADSAAAPAVPGTPDPDRQDSLTESTAPAESTTSAPPDTAVSATTEPAVVVDASEAATTQTPTTSPPVNDDGLVLAGLLPGTGLLDFLGPPANAAARLAVDEINAAGGVLGVEVEFLEGDSGTDPDIANATVDRLLTEGADAFIGALSSSTSLSVIDKITQSGRVMISPANTSSAFTGYDDGGLYFRTAAHDRLQGAALAELLVADGNASVTLLVIDAFYGADLRRFTQDELDSLGATSTAIVYDPSAADFDDVVAEVVALNSDAIAIIGFAETAEIVDALVGVGFGPTQKNVYGVDGNMGGALARGVDDPSVLSGMRGTLPGVDTSAIAGFQERLLAVDRELLDLSYSAETYDAVVLTALASEIAGSSDPTMFAPLINEVTRGGTVCTDFVECRDLVRAGTDIDYDGLSGRLEFSDVGEPTEAAVLVLEFDASGQLFVIESITAS